MTVHRETLLQKLLDTGLLIAWDDLLPAFLRRVLHVGEFSQVLSDTHAARGQEADFIELGEKASAGRSYDAIFFWRLPQTPDAVKETLERFAPALNDTGRLLFLLCAPQGGQSAFVHEQLFPVLETAGFLPYAWHPKDRPGDVAGDCVLTAVRHGYNPLLHAQSLAAAGKELQAIAVIDGIDTSLFPDTETLALAFTQKHEHYLQWLSRHPEPRPGADDRIFHAIQKNFYTIIYVDPCRHPAWRAHAAIWRHFGNEDYAARMLRSVLHVREDAVTRALLETLWPDPATRPAPESAPVWSGARRPPRILIITHDYSDYGLDCLYDGLCSVIGAENVVEYPWKATLHGQRAESAKNYPCVFNHPGAARQVSELESELRAERFDLILYADVVQWARPAEVRRLLAAAPDLPVVVYDTWDSAHNQLPAVQEYLARDTVAAYFKREMLAGVNYGPNAYPLPFAYPDLLVPQTPPPAAARRKDVFWAGKWVFGLRPLYLRRLQEVLGRALEEAPYTQEAYRRELLQSRAGVSFFGFGFDTVRYWELPAHGCLLIAERPLIRIPHNFEDGVTALFFDDLPELEGRLEWACKNPADAEAIARAGHDHFLQYHTASARARQFLARLEQMLSW